MRQRGLIPINLLIYAGIFLAVAAVIAGGVKFLKDAGRDEVRAEWAEAVLAQREEERQKSVNAALGLSDDRKKRTVVTKEVIVYVDQIVDRPVYHNVCLDDAGLLCLRSAIEGKIAAGCKPDGTLPKPAAANRDGR